MEPNKVVQQDFSSLSGRENKNTDEFRKVLRNYDYLLHKIQQMITTKAVCIHLQRAEQHRRENNTPAEIKSLLIALHKMKSKGISNKDLAVAAIQDNLPDLF